MRGEDNKQEAMFSYVSPEKRVPTDHPLRPIRAMVDGILKEMSPQFAKRYADVGRFSSGYWSWPSRICRRSSVRWTGRGSKRGRARRVFGGRTTRGTGPVRAAR